MNQQSSKDLSLLWFWLPMGVVLLQLVVRYVSPEAYELYILGDREAGLVELLTPVALIPGVVFGIMALRLQPVLPTLQSRIWIAMVTLGAFYMAGEEVSWGQWLFHWQTPEAFAAINDQNETNLHNTSAWLDQKPRLLLELWALIGAIRIWVLDARGSQPDPGRTAYWFWPSRPLAWTGLLSAVVMLPERVKDWWRIKLPSPFDFRSTEIQELVLGFFLTFFLVSVWLRLRSRSGG
jgi:hypothetical protein